MHLPAARVRIPLFRACSVALLAAGALSACNSDDDEDDVPDEPPPVACTSDCHPNGLDLPDHGMNVVAKWHELGRLTILPAADPAGATSSERSPTFDLDMPVLTVAMYDALALVSGKYQPFTPGIRGELQATIPADSEPAQQYAASGAACAVLAGLFPLRSSIYSAECDSTQAAADAATLPAWNFGASVAAKVLAWRGDDGRETPLPLFSSIASTEPGQFRSLNPNPAVNPVNYTRPHVRAFSLTSASQFRTDPPYAMTTPEYAADLEQVRNLGSAASTTRTEAQTENARFHTMPPPLFWMSNLLQFATSQPTLVENARLIAALWVAVSDATTGCFESKYHYNYWRPVTAIHLADLDGNLATTPDNAWQPVVPTPNHPEYPSAHSCNTGASAAVLSHVFRTRKLRFTFETSVASVSEAYRQQHYASTDDFVTLIQDARLTGGMHFHNANVQGALLGEKVAQQLLFAHFQAVR